MLDIHWKKLEKAAEREGGCWYSWQEGERPLVQLARGREAAGTAAEREGGDIEAEILGLFRNWWRRRKADHGGEDRGDGKIGREGG